MTNKRFGVLDEYRARTPSRRDVSGTITNNIEIENDRN